MLLEVADNLWQCRDGGALCAGVVHQKALNVVSRATSRAHESVGSNVVAARIARIKVPVHKLIAAVEQSHAQAVHKFRVGIVFAVNRVTATAGETHDARTLAGVFLNQVVEFVEVGKVGVDAFIDFEIVRIGVDCHLMAVFGNGCHTVEVGGELGSDEECGFHPLLAQNVQYLIGAHRWAVVESEIHDFLVFAHHTELFGHGGHIVGRVVHRIGHLVDALSVPVHLRSVDGEFCLARIVGIFHATRQEGGVVRLALHNHHWSTSGECGRNSVVGGGVEYRRSRFISARYGGGSDCG